MTPDADKWVHVRRPAKVVRVRMEPVEPLTVPVVDVPLILVRRPAKVIRLVMEPVEPAVLHLTLTLRPDAAAAAAGKAFGRLTALVEALGGLAEGSGVHVDAAASGPRPGSVVGLVLVPTDPAGAADRLRALARVLATAAGAFADAESAVARVVSAADPGRTLFETAA